MSYEPLTSIFYKRPEDWEQEYQIRFRNPFARHLPVSIHQYGRKIQHQVFYCYTEDAAVLQEQIMSVFNDFQHILRSIPRVGIEQFVNACLINEIKSSNDIEGVHSTRKEIRSAFIAAPNERIRLRLGGIVNKYIKIIRGDSLSFNSCEDIRSFFDEFLADEIRKNNPTLLPDGRIFRSSSVDVVTSTQKIIHRGIYPEEKIIQYMSLALEILHDTTIPYLNRIAIFHFLFGYIHPFYDGNGRISRFMTSYFLSKYLHPTIALQLSIIIKKQRNSYYKLFSNTESDSNKGDLTPFILGTLRLIHTAIFHTEKTLKKKLDTYRSYQKKILALNIEDQTMSSIYDILLQAAIFSDIGATISEIQGTLQKSENTIISRMKKIPPEWLRCIKTSRPYHYKLVLSTLDDN